MGLWYNLQEWFRKFRKKDLLREICREKYGEDFAKMYDMVNRGIPIGNFEETMIFIAMVKAAEAEMEIE